MEWINVNKKLRYINSGPMNKDVSEKFKEVIVIDDDDDDDDEEVIFIDDEDMKTEPVLDQNETITEINNKIKQEVFDNSQIKTEYAVECKIELEEHNTLIDNNSNLLHLKKEIKEERIEATLNCNKELLPPTHQSENSAVTDASSSAINQIFSAVVESGSNINMKPNITQQLSISEESSVQVASLNETVASNATNEGTKDFANNKKAASSDNLIVSETLTEPSTSDLIPASSTASSNPWKHLSRIVPIFSKRENCITWMALNFEALRKMRPPNRPNNKPCRIKLKGPDGKKVPVTIPADPPNYPNAGDCKTVDDSVKNMVPEGVDPKYINFEQARRFEFSRPFKNNKYRFLMRGSKGKSKYITASKSFSQSGNVTKSRWCRKGGSGTNPSVKEGFKKAANLKKKGWKELQPPSVALDVQSTNTSVPAIFTKEYAKNTVDNALKLEEQHRPSTSSSEVVNGQNPQSNPSHSDSKEPKKLHSHSVLPAVGTTNLKDFPNAKISLLEKRCRASTLVAEVRSVQSPHPPSINLLKSSVPPSAQSSKINRIGSSSSVIVRSEEVIVHFTSAQQQNNSSILRAPGLMENVASTSVQEEMTQSKVNPQNSNLLQNEKVLPPLENIQEIVGIKKPTNDQMLKCQQQTVDDVCASVISKVPLTVLGPSGSVGHRSSGSNDTRAVTKKDSLEITVENVQLNVEERKIPTNQPSNNPIESADDKLSLINNSKNNLEKKIQEKMLPQQNLKKPKGCLNIDHDYSELLKKNVASVGNQLQFQRDIIRSKTRTRSNDDCFQHSRVTTASKNRQKLLSTSFVNPSPNCAASTAAQPPQRRNSSDLKRHQSLNFAPKQQIRSNECHNVFSNGNQPPLQGESKMRHFPSNHSTSAFSSGTVLQRPVEVIAEKPISKANALPSSTAGNQYLDQGQGKMRPPPPHRRNSNGGLEQINNSGLKSPSRRPYDKTECGTTSEKPIPVKQNGDEIAKQQTNKGDDEEISSEFQKQLSSILTTLNQLQKCKMEKAVKIINQTYENLKSGMQNQEMHESATNVELIQVNCELSKGKCLELGNNGSVRNSSKVEGRPSGDKPIVEFKTPQGFPVRKPRIAHLPKNAIKNNRIPAKNHQVTIFVADKKHETNTEETVPQHPQNQNKRVRVSPHQRQKIPPHNHPPQRKVPGEDLRTSPNQKFGDPRTSPNQQFPSYHGSTRAEEGQVLQPRQHTKKRALLGQTSPLQVPSKKPRLEEDKRGGSLYLNNQKVSMKKPGPPHPSVVSAVQRKPIKRFPPLSNIQNGIKRAYDQARSVDFSDVQSTVSELSQQSSVHPKPDQNLTKLPEYTSERKTTKWLNVHFCKDKANKKNHPKQAVQQGQKRSSKGQETSVSSSTSHSAKSLQNCVVSSSQSTTDNVRLQRSTVRRSPPQSNAECKTKAQGNVAETLTSQALVINNGSRQNAIEQLPNAPPSALFGSQNQEMPSYSSLLKAVQVLSSVFLLQNQQMPNV